MGEQALHPDEHADEEQHDREGAGEGRPGHGVVTGIFNKLGLDQPDADQHRRVLAVLRYVQG
jgi:hypothetical protein